MRPVPFPRYPNLNHMKNQLLYNISAILFTVFFFSSCTDPKLNQQIMDLQMMNDSLTTLLDSANNCCECGEMPSNLVEIEETTAREAWDRYKTDMKSEKISGTWLDHNNNWYLYCTYKSNIYSGIGMNESHCPMVVYAVQLIAGNDTTYKFYALSSALSGKDCKEIFRVRGSGTCPNHCP
jgi:hypothetical protein